MESQILVVDDMRDNLRLLSGMLAGQGYKVRPVLDGHRALSSARLRPPDLILLDIMMPEMDGYTVCRQLKADTVTRDIPVIFLSALNETEDIIRAFHVGGVDYITKPFHEEEVLARVSAHLELAAMRKRLQEQNSLLQQANELLADEITEHKQTKAELQRAKDAADAANTAKSVFLSNMSHELRSPLTAILGFVQVMARSATLPPEHHEHADIIRRSGEHLLTLINQVLELSKIEAGQITLNEADVDVYRLLADVEDMFRMKAEEKHIRLRFEQRGKIPQYIRTDEIKLRQVLINLLNNALKFTEEGEVNVRVFDCEHSGAIGPDQQSTIFTLTFEIEDTGPGIEPENIEHVFDAFGQAEAGRQSQEGTGLGLPISRKFVQLMGGDMQVKSDVGQRTEFSFTIRTQRVEAADREPGIPTRRVIALEPAQQSADSPYRVLLADDSTTNRLLLATLLEPLGFDFREAANGEEAVEIWDAWRPHLIWMDMRMPVLDGYEATQRIKAMMRGGQETKIIALTASSLEEERIVAMNAGCDDYLRKPFREDEFFTLISKHIGVQFVYEEQTPADPSAPGQAQNTAGSEYRFARNGPWADSDGQKADTELTPKALEGLPAEWLVQLKQGAQDVDITLLFSVIEQIRERDALLADALAKLVNDFEYDEILSLIE